MSTEPTSFGWHVWDRAISETIRFFGYKVRDIVLGVTTFTLGLGLAIYFVGKVDTMKEIGFMAVFTFAPAGFLLFAVFLWNLWLAPSALTYTTAVAALERAALAQPSAKPEKLKSSINWAVWRQRAKYTLYEFAAILANEDPASGQMNNETSAFASLLIESVKEKKLNAARIEWDLAGEVGGLTEIMKPDALAWARYRDFSVRHIE